MEEKYLCCSCVDDPYLKKEIESQGIESKCSYCGRKAATYTLSSIADMVDLGFKEYYRRTESSPDQSEVERLTKRFPGYKWTQEGEPVVVSIQAGTQIRIEAARDVQGVLESRYKASVGTEENEEEAEFASSSHYEEVLPSSDPFWWKNGPPNEDNKWHAWWESLVHSLETEKRFFNCEAAGILEAVFDGIEHIETIGERTPVVVVGAGTESRPAIYRARVFQSRKQLLKAMCLPDEELGPPPSDIAPPPGRMNARGISVFYGATSRDVALSEVRPAVGSIVLTARFDVTRHLRILDLGVLGFLSMRGSIFNPEHNKERKTQIAFLQSLCDRLGNPVLPDFEGTDYVVTQAVADFLAGHKTLQLDGIQYPSVQNPYADGSNLLLFKKASRVEKLKITKKTIIKVISGFCDKGEWEFFEGAPEAVYTKTGGSLFDSGDLEYAELWRMMEDPREVSLRVDPNSIELHRIESVVVGTEDVERVRRTVIVRG